MNILPSRNIIMEYGVVLQKSLKSAILAPETSRSSAHLNCM
jgi:hypothetical protein